MRARKRDSKKNLKLTRQTVAQLDPVRTLRRDELARAKGGYEEFNCWSNFWTCSSG